MDANILNDNCNLLAGFFVIIKVTNSVRNNINSDNRVVHFLRVVPFIVPQFLGPVQHDYLGMPIMEQNKLFERLASPPR
jgi:hypothetical protein